MNIKTILAFTIILHKFKVAQAFHVGFCTSLNKDDISVLTGKKNYVFSQNVLDHSFGATFGQSEPFTDYRVKVTGITVKNNEGKTVPLQGYVHMSFDLRTPSTSKRTKINGYIIQTINVDGTRGAFGEFVTNFPMDKCPDVKKDIDSGLFYMPTKHQFVPCNGINLYDSVPSNIFVYNQNKEIMPERSEVVHLVWRFSNHYCNHEKNIILRVSIAPEDGPNSAPLGFRAVPTVIHLKNVLTGAPDPLPSANSIESCDVNLDGGLYPWVNRIEELNGYIDVVKSGSCKDGSYSAHDTSARCKSTNGDNNQQCIDQTDLPGLMEYDDYLEFKLKEQNELCKCPPLPMTAKTEPPLQVLPSKAKTTTTTTEEPVVTEDDSIRVNMEMEKNRVHGIYADKFPGIIVWNFRTVHGMSAIIGTIFVTPISTFVARYYKETFMEHEIMFNRVWYMVHLIAVFVNVNLHVYGGVAIRQARILLGNSKSDAALSHRIVSGIAIGLFLTMTVLGGFRPQVHKWRRIVIGLHWAGGITYYIFCLIGCITSIYIHGSPSSTSDVSTTETNEWQWILTLIGAWILIDIGSNIAMIMHGCHVDSLIGLKREYLPVPMPIIDEDEEGDAPGAEFRMRMLIFYVIASFIVTLSICIWMKLMPVKGRGFGIMTCSHDDSNKLTDYSDACKLKF